MRKDLLFTLLQFQLLSCYANYITDDTSKKEIIHPTSSSVTHNGRHLRGENCFPTADVQCRLRSDNSKCEDIIVQNGECGLVPVQFKFKFCNMNEDLTITLKEEKTFGKIFNKQISMNTKPLVPGKCRMKKVNSKVNTCKKSHVTAQLKVEGKIPIKKGDDYCYAFYYYSKKITKVEAFNMPTLDWDIELECFAESMKGSGVYDKPCENLELKDFQATPTRHYQEESFLFIYKLKNDSGEEVQISDVTVLFNDLEVHLVQDYVTVSPHSDFTSDGDVVNVNLNQFGGGSIGIGGAATAIGEVSDLTVSEAFDFLHF